MNTFNYKNNCLDYIRLFASIQVLLGHYFKFYEKLSSNPFVPMNWFAGMIILFSLSGFFQSHLSKNRYLPFYTLKKGY